MPPRSFSGDVIAFEQRLLQGARDDGHVADVHALLVPLDGDVEHDVALQVAQQRERHRERDAELLLEQRIAGTAPEVEVVQRHVGRGVVLARAERRLGGERQAAAPDAVRRERRA